MIRLVRAEYRKLVSTQVWFWMLLTVAALTALGVVGRILGTDDNPGAQQDYVRGVLMSATGAFTYIPLFVLGVLGVTTEYRYQTITPAVLTTPIRWRIVVAKLIFYAIAGAAYALVCLLLELAMALPWLSTRGRHVSLSDNAAALFSVFLVLAIFAVVGVGVGALIKNQIVAVSVGVIVLVILDRILLAIPAVKYVYPYTLDGAVGGIVTGPHEDRSINGVHLLHIGSGVTVLIVWALVTAGIGAFITMNRDIT
jgi:ABC-2 type transport system permease protein